MNRDDLFDDAVGGTTWDYEEFEAQRRYHESRSIPLSEVEEQPVRWLIDGLIQRGMVTIVTGMEGLGKSQFALKVAARFTQGFYGDISPRTGEQGGIVKYYSAEDPATYTLKPRAVANQAVLQDFLVERRDAETWLPEGLKDIRREVDEMRAGLVVVDPVIGYFDPRTNSNNLQDVRQVMDGLSAIAEESGAVIIGVMHPKKGEEVNASTSSSVGPARSDRPRVPCSGSVPTQRPGLPLRPRMVGRCG